MEIKFKQPAWAIVLNVFISFIIIGLGVYTLLEKKMIISGKYSGNLYSLGSLESIVIAISHFMLATFFILVLVDNKNINKAGECFFIAAVILFLSSTFI